jgi:hypothetical protein
MAPQQVRDVNAPISMRNERAALQLLSSMVTELLTKYPKSLAEDLELLAAGPDSGGLAPFSNERHAVIQVAGEKEVLVHYRTHCRQALAALAVPCDNDLEYSKLLMDMGAGGLSKWILDYCGEGPRAEVGTCRRLERRRLQQEAATATPSAAAAAESGGGARSDPSKPHIV